MPRARQPSPPPRYSRNQLAAAGDWLLNQHFASYDPAPTREQVMEMLANPKLMAETVRQAFTLNPAALFAPLPISKHVYTRTQSILNALDEAVRLAPLTGIPVEAALNLLADNLDIRIQPATLRHILLRNYPLHQLRWHDMHVRLRADVVIMTLARNLKAEKQSRRLLVDGRRAGEPSAAPQPPVTLTEKRARATVALQRPGRVA